MASTIKLKTLLRYGAILLWMVFVLLPIYTAIVASFTSSENLGKQFLFFQEFHWQNYADVFTKMSFFENLKASVIYSVFASILSVAVAAFAAYAMARHRFKGKSAFFVLLLIVQTIPQIVVVIPIFVLLNQFGLYDTYLGVILTIAATSLPLPILMLHGFFKGLPVELEEAALIDGCSKVGVLYRIVLPLAAPGVMTAFALSFFMGWAEYLIPMVLTLSPEKVPLTVGIARLVDVNPPWELIMAGTLISTIPPLIAYFFAQRYLVEGLTVGGVKG